MLTRWHKTFHFLVFGSMAVLVVAIPVIRRGYHADSIAQVTPAVISDADYGGDTPEETFALFLAALKDGDTDLAAKYFISSKAEGWRESLNLIKSGGGLEQMLGELEHTQANWILENASATSTVFGYGAQKVKFIRTDESARWKISDL